MMEQWKKISLAFMLLTLAAISAWGQLNIGDKAPDFKLKNIDGQQVGLTDFADAKGFIIVFTCNTCPYAKAYEDRILKLNDKYGPKGVPVIAINPNDPGQQPGDSYAAMQQRAREKGFTFPYLVDETQQTARAYGASRTPHVFLLSADRTVVYIGAIDNNFKSDDPGNTRYVEDAVNATLAGQSVEKEMTKAIGCAIKWK
jgi:peroxiredoxin